MKAKLARKRMNAVTSIFDYYRKKETDKRYDYLVRLTYKQCQASYSLPSLERAIEWMEEWLRENKDRDDGCRPMVQALNDNLSRVVQKYPLTVPRESKADE
jgi:hypothetical protein